MLDDNIPVTFSENGITYHGYFSNPNGGGNSWHLMVNNCYWGTLIMYQDWPKGLPMDFSIAHAIEMKWRFASQTGRFEELADYFGDVVIAWYQ